MSIRFNGNSSNYLSRSTSLPDYNSTYTIMAWIKLKTDTNTRATFFNLATGSANNFDIGQFSSDGTTLEVAARISGTLNSDSGSTLSVDQWEHVCMRRASVTDLSLFLDAVLDAGAVTTDVTGRTAQDAMEIGRTHVDSFTGEPLDAEMAYLRIWTTDLTTGEIEAEKNSIVAIKTAGLYGDYPMATGATAGDDVSGQSHPFTVNGTISDGASEPPVILPVGPSLFRGRGFSFFDDEEVNRFEFWPAIADSGEVTLTIQNASHTHTAQNLDLTQDHNLAVQNAAHAHTAENVVLIQDHTLAIQDGAHSHTVENVAVTQSHVLTVQNGLHAHSAENLTVTQVHGLVIQDATHGHSAENLTLTQVHGLVIDGAVHTHSAENAALTQVHILSVQNGFHGHTADNLSLDGSANLVIQDALHAHSAESLVVTQVHVLAVQNADHLHIAQSLTLTQVHELTVQNGFHAHVADALVLTQGHGLSVQNAAHGHSAESLNLAQNHNLVIQGADHAHAAENLTLSQAHILSISAGNHAHTAETLALTQTYVLTIQSGFHAHTAENVSFATKIRTILTYRSASITTSTTSGGILKSTGQTTIRAGRG